MIRKPSKDLSARIETRTGKTSIEREIAMQLFHLAEKHCADSGMLQDVRAVLNSWGHTRNAEEVLTYLKGINDTGRVFHAVFARNSSDG
jgi:hypothetical protein